MTKEKKSKIKERIDAQSFGLGYKDAMEMEKKNLEKVKKEYEIAKKINKETKELIERMKSFAKAKKKLKGRSR